MFELSAVPPKQLSLAKINRSPALTCGAPNYKCLRCDEKKVICLACSVNCHKGHPVCFLNIPPEFKGMKCQEKDQPNEGNKYFKPPLEPSQGGLFKGMRGHDYVPVPAPPQDSL